MPLGEGHRRRPSRAHQSVEIGKYAANSERSGLSRSDPTQIIIIGGGLHGIFFATGGWSARAFG